MNELDQTDKDLLHRAHEEFNKANAILRFLSDYFRDKYQLTPTNQITPDGKIVGVSISENSSKKEDNGQTNSLPNYDSIHAPY